jgi:hypothetical protein
MSDCDCWDQGSLFFANLQNLHHERDIIVFLEPILYSLFEHRGWPLATEFMAHSPASRVGSFLSESTFQAVRVPRRSASQHTSLPKSPAPLSRLNDVGKCDARFIQTIADRLGREASPMPYAAEALLFRRRNKSAISDEGRAGSKSSRCVQLSKVPSAPSAASATNLRRDRRLKFATTTVAPIWLARAPSGLYDRHRRC